MRLSPLFSQYLEAATQSGIEQVIQQERRKIIENLLVFRFGKLDSKLEVIIEQIIKLPKEDFTRLILQLSNLSREQLLAIFEGENK